MRIQIEEQPQKIVYIWISQEEGRNQELLDSLKPQYPEWKRQGYLPVVMESGGRRFEDLLYLLMKINYERMAEEQLKAEGLWLSKEQGECNESKELGHNRG